jgi:hypothetical protein
MLNVPDEIYEKMCYSSLFDTIKNNNKNHEDDLTFKELKNLNFDITKKTDLNEAFKKDFNGTARILPVDYDEFLTQINEEYQDRRLTAEDILIGLNVLNTKINILFFELSKNINRYSNITFNGEPIVDPKLLDKSRDETELHNVIVNLDEENPTMVTIIRNLLDILNNIYNDKSNNDFNNTIFKLLFSMSVTLSTNYQDIILSIFKLFNTNTQGGLYIIDINHINSPMIRFSYDKNFLENKLTDEVFDAKKNEYIKQLSDLFGIDETKMSGLFLDQHLSNSLDILFIPETSNFIISEIETITSICVIDNENPDLKETIFLAYILVYKTYNFNENTMTIDIKIRWVIDDDDIIRLINYYSLILNAGINNNFEGIQPDSKNVNIKKTIILLINLYMCMLRKKNEYNLEEYLNVVQDFSNETSRNFYDELKVNNDIIPKNNFNFDFIQSTSISEWVDENLKKIYEINDFINFDEFINNNNKYFELNDFKKPIFNVLFNILMSEITKYNLYLNDNHILKYDEDVVTGNKINASINDNKWAIDNFIPCLFEIYETSYKQTLTPNEFNLKFFELLYSFSLFIDINIVFNDIIRTFNEYNIVSTKLNKTSYEGLLIQTEKYVTKYAKKLSILFDIPEDKIKETILNFGTVVINLNFENIIITNTSTIILTYNENGSIRRDFNMNNIIGIILIQNNYNLLTNENQLNFECRWYIPDNNKTIYKNAINDYKINFLNCLQSIQQQKISENYLELEKTESVCDSTLNLLIDEIKNNRVILEILSTSNKNAIKFTKHSKLNFDSIFELGLHEYYKNTYFKQLNGKEEDFDDYLLSISNRCLDENYALEIYNKDEKDDKSKIHGCLDSIGKDINSYDEIIVNDTIIFNKNSKNINGDIITRLNGFEYLVNEFLPILFNIYKANYRSIDCKKFNEGFINLIFSLVLSDIPSFLLFSIKEAFINNYNNPFNIVNINYLMLNKLLEQDKYYIDLKNIDINTLAKAFDTSLKNIQNIYLFNKIKINITEDNVIIKKTTTYGILFMDPSGLLGILLVTEIYNLKNNTYNTTCQMRWTPNISVIKQNILLIKNAYDELSDDEKQEKQENMNKIMTYYRCIYLNGLSPEQIQDINSGSDDSMEWPEIKLNTFEKIKQKWNILKETHPKKIVAGIGSAVGLATTGISLASVLGGKKTKTKRNMKRINKKRVTRNYMKKNTLKKTRKGVKKVKKTRNTKKRIRNE